MNIHKNARMTVHGRALLVSRILDERWRVADAARASASPINGWRAPGRAARQRSVTASRHPSN